MSSDFGCLSSTHEVRRWSTVVIRFGVMTIPVVFLSGAGLPSWIWDPVRAGLPTTTVVAGRPRGDVTVPSRGGTVTDYARAAVELVPEGPFAVVAHSAGGVIAGELALMASGRVVAVLGIAAVVPAAGASFTASLPFPARAVLPLMLRLAGTRPPESSIRRSLAGGLDEDVTRRLLTDFHPEPRTYFTSASSGEEYLHAVPGRQYLITTADPEFPVAVQRRFARRLGVPAPLHLDSGHLPMLTHPDAVTSAIQDLLGIT